MDVAGGINKEQIHGVGGERKEGDIFWKRGCMGSLHVQCMRDFSEVVDERSWQWLRGGYFGKKHGGVCFCCSGAGFASKVFSDHC